MKILKIYFNLKGMEIKLIIKIFWHIKNCYPKKLVFFINRSKNMVKISFKKYDVILLKDLF